MREQNIGDLVCEFGESVASQADAVARGDPETGNKFAKRYVDIFGELCRRGNEGRDALAVLLDDPRAPVRIQVAAYLLRHCGQRAQAVLEKEARGRGMHAFAARQALKRWAEGTWQLDRE
jgi:hypothetical protein